MGQKTVVEARDFKKEWRQTKALAEKSSEWTVCKWHMPPSGEEAE